MLEGVLIFLLFLGPLVFFHELGHFIMARIAGVKVETFSIGFGPKLIKYKWGDTVYAFSLIPLGGYVKMFGDDPTNKDELSLEDQKLAYNYKSKFARFWIVFGGPLANFIMAFVLYFGLVFFGEKVPEVRFDVVDSQSVFGLAGIKSGDVLAGINDDEILSFDDLNLADNEIFKISVKRGENIENIPLKTNKMEFIKNYQEIDKRLRSPLVVDKDNKTWLISLDSKIINLKSSLDEINENAGGVIYVSRFDEDFNQVKETLIPASSKMIEIRTSQNELLNQLSENGFYPIDLMVKSIVMKSAAEAAGLKAGDIIEAINNKKMQSFYDVRETISSYKDGLPLVFRIVRGEEILQLDVTPSKNEKDGVVSYSIGIESATHVLPLGRVDTGGKGFFTSFKAGFFRTYHGIVKTLVGFKMLIFGEVSLGNIGGPLAIGKVATDSFNVSLSMFFRLMAIISINLGIINLFPIPVLDGGHIVFIMLEALNGGPLSRRKMELAQQFGLSLLFLLIFVALFNDISRFFL